MKKFTQPLLEIQRFDDEQILTQSAISTELNDWAKETGARIAGVKYEDIKFLKFTF